MVSAALVLLVSQLPFWWFALPVVAIISREIFVSALRELMAERGVRAVVKVGNLGKLKTACQMVSTALLLAAPAELDLKLLTVPSTLSAGMGLLYIATALTVLSGAQYLVAAWPAIVGAESAN